MSFTKLITIIIVAANWGISYAVSSSIKSQLVQHLYSDTPKIYSSVAGYNLNQGHTSIQEFID